ncbi:hypothetical protein C0991_001985 [Blastosporella zonata]|nr:hypothetical protein C0991_001985 [Blastosporella zonata]
MAPKKAPAPRSKCNAQQPVDVPQFDKPQTRRQSAPNKNAGEQSEVNGHEVEIPQPVPRPHPRPIPRKKTSSKIVAPSPVPRKKTTPEATPAAEGESPGDRQATREPTPSTPKAPRDEGEDRDKDEDLQPHQPIRQATREPTPSTPKAPRDKGEDCDKDDDEDRDEDDDEARDNDKDQQPATRDPTPSTPKPPPLSQPPRTPTRKYIHRSHPHSPSPGSFRHPSPTELDCESSEEELEEDPTTIEEDPTTTNTQAHPGCISDDVKARVFAAHREYTETMEALAAKAKKPVQTLYGLVGGGHKPYRRRTSQWGAWEAGYKVHGETKKTAKMTSQQWNALVATKYNDYCKEHLGEHWQDKEDRAELFQPIVDWYKEKFGELVVAKKEDRSFTKLLSKTRDEFMHLGRLAYEYYGVHCFGFIVDIDPDNEGHTASAMWGCTDAFEQMKKKEKSLLPRLQTGNPSYAQIQLARGWDIKKCQSIKMSWVNWPNVTYDWKICMVNWPTTARAPNGDHYDIKKKNTKTTEAMQASNDARRNQDDEDSTIRIVAWDLDDQLLTVDDKTLRRVVLVANTRNEASVIVGDASKYRQDVIRSKGTRFERDSRSERDSGDNNTENSRAGSKRPHSPDVAPPKKKARTTHNAVAGPSKKSTPAPLDMAKALKLAKLFMKNGLLEEEENGDDSDNDDDDDDDDNDDNDAT